jgi:hypothetical protein
MGPPDPHGHLVIGQKLFYLRLLDGNKFAKCLFFQKIAGSPMSKANLQPVFRLYSV